MTPTALALALAVLSAPTPPVVRPVEPTEANRRAAVEKALPLLWKGMEGYNAKRDCFACHHHAVPLLAVTTAATRGFAADRKKLDEQTAFITDHFEGMRERLEKGNGPGPVGGGPDNTSYAMLALDLLGVEPNKTTAALAGYTLDADAKGDHWPSRGSRPPSEVSGFTTTALALRGVQKYAPEAKKEQVAKRVEAARGWLLKTTPKDTEERVFRLIGLKESGAKADDLAAAVKDLLGTQEKDGGWAQTGRYYSDAYATGSALYALHTAGGVKADDPAYVKGVAFLLGTQLDDGSWHVRSRSKPFQKYFETGFPHGTDQFISCAATGWATAAIALACEKK